MNNAPCKISVISPVYGCADCLEELVKRIHGALSPLGEEYEIILVNDKSPDNAKEVIWQIAAQDPRVKGVDLSRNFGQHYAITAGIDLANGDWIAVLDCDLQDQPEEIPRLLAKGREGFEIVVGYARHRLTGSFAVRALSRYYYKLLDFLGDHNSETFHASFILMSRKAAEGFKQMRETRRQFVSLVQYLGFSMAFLPVRHMPRNSGQTSYPFLKRLSFAIHGITSSTTKLLRMGAFLGLLFSSLSFLYLVSIVISWFFFQVQAGWTSLMASVYFVGGIIMFLIGIIGYYIETIFFEVKRRPLYLVDETINLPSSPSPSSAPRSTEQPLNRGKGIQ